MEMLPKQHQTAVTSGWNVQEAMIYVLATLYFWKISQHWFPFTFIGYCWNVISIVLQIWVPESPRWLISAGRIDEARKAFEVIAMFNKQELDWDESKFMTPQSPKVPFRGIGSSESGRVIEVLEIRGLPSTAIAKEVKAWVRKQIGQLFDEISNSGLL